MSEDIVGRDCLTFRRHMQSFSMVFTLGMNNILGRGGINLPQYNTLSILKEEGNLKMGDLARRLGVTMGAATNLADRLVNVGSVSRQRDDQDRSVVRLALTAKGRKHVEEIDATFVGFCTGVMGQLPPEQRARFLADFGHVLSLMQQHCAPPPETTE